MKSLLVTFFVLLIAFFIVRAVRKNEELLSDYRETIGVVVTIGKFGLKNHIDGRYQFTVGDSSYVGLFMHQEMCDQLSYEEKLAVVGDSIAIVYNPKDPTNNAPIISLKALNDYEVSNEALYRSWVTSFFDCAQ